MYRNIPQSIANSCLTYLLVCLGYFHNILLTFLLKINVCEPFHRSELCRKFLVQVIAIFNFFSANVKAKDAEVGFKITSFFKNMSQHKIFKPSMGLILQVPRKLAEKQYFNLYFTNKVTVVTR